MKRIAMLLLFACCAAQRTTAPAAAPAAQAAPAPAAQAAPATPAAVPAEALVDHSGDSVETAISVPADAEDGGVEFENRWIYDRYGRFRRNAGGTGTVNGRRYNVVKIELPNGEKKSVFFDITENWDRWQPAPPPQ